MRIVINARYGGYGYRVPEKYDYLLYAYEYERNHHKLVEFVENHPDECGDLKICEVPDEATDWMIDERDGNEQVIYVLNGRLHVTF
jgi:hypothetical protein